MVSIVRTCDVILLIITFLYVRECTEDVFENLDKNYHLVNEAYNVAKSLFNQGRANYERLKSKSLKSMETLLDLVYIMNEQMAKKLRTAVIKFYKIKYFQDFSRYMVTMDEAIDIVEHCLVDPVEKLDQIRTQFHGVIKNFRDARNFDTVAKCHNEIPDEVAAAFCLLHQAVLILDTWWWNEEVQKAVKEKKTAFNEWKCIEEQYSTIKQNKRIMFNETMEESLITIIEIKTRLHAQDMNSSLYNVQNCLNDLIPKFFEVLLLDAYTEKSEYLRVVNASVSDLIKDKWRGNEVLFPDKWSPVVTLLKAKTKPPKHHLQEPLFLTLFAANITPQDIVKTLY